MLSLPEKPEFDHPGSILYFRTAGAVTHLRDCGASVESGPQLVARMPDREFWMAFFQDSEGNQVALMSEVRG
jgi:methylmalonyl-CoA/ethylmalonyl-CoA epimerase